MRCVVAAGLLLGGSFIPCAASAQQAAGSRLQVGPPAATLPTDPAPLANIVSQPPHAPGARDRMIGAWVPAGRARIGLGLYRVPRSETPDHVRSSNPMREKPNRTRRIAAVGLNLSF